MSMLKFYDEIPVKEQRRGRRKEFVEILKQHPMKWAEYPDAPHSAGTAGVLKAAFPGLQTAKRGDRVFARWVGEPQPKRESGAHVITISPYGIHAS